MTTARKLWDTESDLLAEDKVQFVDMDYDMKRRPVDPEMGIATSITEPHLRFSTRPHRTYKEYQKARKVFDQFKEPMKLTGDLEAFLQDVDTYGSKKKNVRSEDCCFMQKMCATEHQLVMTVFTILMAKELSHVRWTSWSSPSPMMRWLRQQIS